tara:strand:+ start:214 stop:441 length:228 start_codon:yes stop_codon:yes gene_type:complete
MDKSKIKIIKQSIAKILNVSETSINDNSKAEDFSKWDSLAHIRIIIELEKIFKKKIKTSKIPELNSVKSIIEHLR